MSGENKWTPGPWRILGEDESIGGVPFIEVMGGEIATPTYRDVTHVCADLGDDDEFRLTDEDWANAHLIAAAPDMADSLAKGDPVIESAVKFLCEKSEHPHDEYDVLAQKLGQVGDRNAAALARARNEGGGGE